MSSRDYLNVRAKGVPSKNPDLHPRHAGIRSQASQADKRAGALFAGFLERLKNFRVLDPACGSGNFLYLALKALKDVELQANIDAEELGLGRQFPVTGPHNVLGIEVNEYAAELARATIWIGELQWLASHGYGWRTDPILAPLEQIQRSDALLTEDGRESTWPRADVVVGNPPFVGDKRMRAELGDAYTERLRAAYVGRVPGGADLVCYWFEKCRALIDSDAVDRFGLVATQAIRKGANRNVIDRVVAKHRIFEAWSNERWWNNGASVRVSLMCVGEAVGAAKLDGVEVDRIFADLSAGLGGDVSRALPLADNKTSAFQGPSKVGDFDIPGDLARAWLRQPNASGCSNSEVLKPWMNGNAVTDRPGDQWIIDFGASMPVEDAAFFELPFEYVSKHVLPVRLTNNREAYKRYWWRFAEARAGMRRAIGGLPRSIITPRVAKHRVFSWLHRSACADTRLYVIARADDMTFGVLHSRVHEVWSLANASAHGVGNDPTYNAGTCFESFGFPLGLTPADTANQRMHALPDGALVPADLQPAVRLHAEAIARAAKRLVDLRDSWLNPPEWVERAPEVVPLGQASSPYPDRIVAKSGHEVELAKRTLTNLYNVRPTWLAQAHAALDAAVAAAYGWDDYTPAMADAEILRRLLAVNLARSAQS